MLAEQVRHPVARGGRGNARSKLTPELRTDRAREHAADQDDDAAHRMEIGLRLTNAAGAIVDQRHGEQLGCGDKASEGRKPKIQPQCRENDEDEIHQRHGKAERLARAHGPDLQDQDQRRQRRFDQCTDIAPDHREVAIEPEVPSDLDVDPDLEQDEADQQAVDLGQAFRPAPDPVHDGWIDQIDGSEKHGHDAAREDQRPHPQQLGAQHLSRQLALEILR
ncbi:hypothetical protein ACVWWK_004444 [Bradyrhizobium sp. LB9.1b]